MIRRGFVSNSSSTSFIVNNKTDEDLTLLDFVKENPQLVSDFIEQYSWHEENRYNQEVMIQCAESRGTVINSGKNIMTFGDEDGDVLGVVFDYMLRDGGNSESFSWKFHEFRR